MHLRATDSIAELEHTNSAMADAELWERDPVTVQVDPFFVPVTEEEREEFGEEGQGVGAPNLARRLIDAVRRRKGLAVEEKVRDTPNLQRV